MNTGSVAITGARNTRGRLAVGVVGVCIAVAIVAPDPDPYRRSLLHFHDFLHVPGFALIVGALLVGFDTTYDAPRRLRFRRLLGVSAVATVIGVGIELIQWLVGGSADPWDVARDGGGIVIAGLWAASRWREVRVAARRLLQGAALALAVAFLLPTLDALLDEAYARHQFPVLADFSTRAELTRFDWSAQSRAVLEPADRADSGHRVLHLFLSPGTYPGLTFEFFPRDWRGWSHFVLVCTNPGGAPFPLTIRINDLKHNQEYTDRYNGTFMLAPGVSEIRVPLADVEAAPRTRKLDLGNVALVVAFSYNLREPRELLIRQIRLER